MLTVYGHSDDLIEVEGDIEEEFNPSQDYTFLTLSNGAVFKIGYTDEGMWRIFPVVPGTGQYVIHQATDLDDDYSDRLIVEDRIDWIVCADRIEQRRG